MLSVQRQAEVSCSFCFLSLPRRAAKHSEFSACTLCCCAFGHSTSCRRSLSTHCACSERERCAHPRRYNSYVRFTGHAFPMHLLLRCSVCVMIYYNLRPIRALAASAGDSCTCYTQSITLGGFAYRCNAQRATELARPIMWRRRRNAHQRTQPHYTLCTARDPGRKQLSLRISCCTLCVSCITLRRVLSAVQNRPSTVYERHDTLFYGAQTHMYDAHRRARNTQCFALVM
jgi:hypothetical protein